MIKRRKTKAGVNRKSKSRIIFEAIRNIFIAFVVGIIVLGVGFSSIDATTTNGQTSETGVAVIIILALGYFIFTQKFN